MKIIIKKSQSLLALFFGLLFGSGLFVSGMADPSKVIGFLNVTGQWDPSLLLVMAGALAVYLPVYQLYVGKRIKADKPPLLAGDYKVPTSKDVDLSLIYGAAMFGVGWGMVGICPGPALASILLGEYNIIFFVASMSLGIRVACWLKEKRSVKCTKTARGHN